VQAAATMHNCRFPMTLLVRESANSLPGMLRAGGRRPARPARHISAIKNPAFDGGANDSFY